MTRPGINILIIILLTLIFCEYAGAYSDYQKYFYQEYPFSPFASECSVCHFPDKSLNAYAKDWKKYDKSFFEISELDSDEDGFENIAEILNGTNPGDSRSHPDLPPVPEAGPDQTVKEWTMVTLDGSESFDSDGTIISYEWSQAEGVEVIIINPGSSRAGFTAPDVKHEGSSLKFELTVTDSKGQKRIDSCTVMVLHTPEGHMDDSGLLKMNDAILALRTSAQGEDSSPVSLKADVNADNRIGLEEVIYVLGKISDSR
jgi:hypothetical protein